ncbi:hypothetical protein JI739_12055 [Ramlibacter sp. AW1]|uniref:RidA family protein n=1 Tax=Ramlibacter aurantiacus TaxID=2801330 RepID=A0A936ZJR6_9BURK|nr:hypothetical protein [Ramlibacter aurantiacus]MBL0421082.1 hypothetical protein [Ramlibacter aurantiacus]
MTIPTDHRLADFTPGSYRYIEGGFQYSAAVQALPGFAIERVRLERPLPLEQGFAAIEDYLRARGRPLTALCACELRSPQAMSEAEFVAFNRRYVRTLADWGLLRDERNPVARCNLVPVVDQPAQAVLYAFSHTVQAPAPAPAPARVRDFVVSGAAECPDRPNYREHIVRLGETTPDALAEKLHFAMDDLGSRLATLGLQWSDVMEMRLYTAHALDTLWSELAARGGLAGGVGSHHVRPPILDLEIEVDARRTSCERLLAG